MLGNAEAIQPGDIIIMSAGAAATMDNSAPAVKVPVGVAMEKKTAAATATVDDVVVVALAVPGRPFLGNLTNAGTTDVTAYAVSTHQGQDFGIVEADHGGFAVLDTNNATGPALVLSLAREQMRGVPPSLTASVILNPRVYFTFNDTLLLAKALP